MNKSLFITITRKAHAMVKRIKEVYRNVNYRFQFSLCFKYLYNKHKEEEKRMNQKAPVKPKTKADIMERVYNDLLTKYNEYLEVKRKEFTALIEEAKAHPNKMEEIALKMNIYIPNVVLMNGADTKHFEEFKTQQMEKLNNDIFGIVDINLKTFKGDYYEHDSVYKYSFTTTDKRDMLVSIRFDFKYNKFQWYIDTKRFSHY